MHFRSQRKLQGEVSLADTLESTGEGGSLSLMDVIAVDDNMLEDLDTRDACQKVRRCVETCLTPRERTIIIRRYGLDDLPPQTQREIAAQCGISRSYVSHRCYGKRRLKATEQIGIMRRLIRAADRKSGRSPSLSGTFGKKPSQCVKRKKHASNIWERLAQFSRCIVVL
ncbi:MAG: sigma factor-like helix-turn-helix DNA-binding protein [Lawsonibacter sp.]|nr:sigma factor-like helix-turn-helix DNA-binding protein [Lawsonibacter sp.]